MQDYLIEGLTDERGKVERGDMLISAASAGAFDPPSGTTMCAKFNWWRDWSGRAQVALRQRAHLHGEPTIEEVAHHARQES
jgi:hypothetical protein